MPTLPQNKLVVLPSGRALLVSEVDQWGNQVDQGVFLSTMGKCHKKPGKKDIPRSNILKSVLFSVLLPQLCHVTFGMCTIGRVIEVKAIFPTPHPLVIRPNGWSRTYLRPVPNQQIHRVIGRSWESCFIRPKVADSKGWANQIIFHGHVSCLDFPCGPYTPTPYLSGERFTWECWIPGSHWFLPAGVSGVNAISPPQRLAIL